MSDGMQLSLPMPGLSRLQHQFVPMVVEIEAIPPEPLRRVVTLEALPPDPAAIAAERGSVVGSWNGGRRYVRRDDRLANIWFHFALGGHGVLSLRYEGQRCAKLTSGRWEISGGVLSLHLGHTTIEGPFSIRGDVMRWAGETLLRVSTQPLQVEQV
jgi:hypothetical protein